MTDVVTLGEWLCMTASERESVELFQTLTDGGVK